MKIRKIEQGTVPSTSRVLTEFNESKLDTYSCNTINTMLNSLESNDPLPVGTILDFEGDEIPEGYGLVEDNPLNTYSTEEQIIGTWVNGKPIYRRVVQASADTLPFSIDTGATNIEDLITGKLQIKQSASQDSSWRTIPWLYNSGNGSYGLESWCGGWYLGESGIMHIQTGANLSKIQKYIVIVEYTKTTD